MGWLRFGVWLGLCACTGASQGGDGTAATPVAAAPAPPAPAEPAAAAPKVTLSPMGRDPVTVSVELAQTPEERRRGLMHREHLGEADGMLFLFERSQQLSFWMRNTLIPLDMIFITEEMVVLGIVENAEPMTDDGRSVPGQSRFVLEVNAGFSRKHGLTAGTPVGFVGVEVDEAAP